MLKSLYEIISSKGDDLSIEYLDSVKEYNLFKPILLMESIGMSDKVKLILFVAHCYSKDSPFLKTNDTAWNTKSLVMDELEISDDIRSKINEYAIPELDQVIKDYISREDNEFIREWLVARTIYDRNLTASASAVDKDGNIDVKRQKEQYEAAQDFKSKIFQLRQQVEIKDYMFTEMKKDFAVNVKSLRVEDLIP